MCIDGPVDGDVFLTFVRQMLVPTLREGDIVVMDNLSVHKVEGVRRAIADAGAFLLFQPRYSPDVNPIEMLWSWVKSRMRDRVETSKQRLVELVGDILAEMPQEFIPEWFRHCGYTGLGKSE